MSILSLIKNLISAAKAIRKRSSASNKVRRIEKQLEKLKIKEVRLQAELEVAKIQQTGLSAPKAPKNPVTTQKDMNEYIKENNKVTSIDKQWAITVRGYARKWLENHHKDTAIFLSDFNSQVMDEFDNLTQDELQSRVYQVLSNHVNSSVAGFIMHNVE